MAGSVDNTKDVARKFPVVALADKLISNVEGTLLEVITGAGIAGTVKLSRPALSLTLVVAFTTASGNIKTPAMYKDGTQFDFSKKGAVSGVAELKNKDGVDHSIETWAVWYHADEADGTGAGLSSLKH